jgi:outer membrane protein OmpA-like peptidoglycan-associated protein
LLGAGVIAFLAFLMSNRAPTDTPSTLSTKAPEPTAPVAARVDTASFLDRKLPSGVTLHVPPNGVEARLIAFIENKDAPVSDTNWLTFDRLEFETNSATLKPSSQEQLRNIADIMKAFPQVKAKFGGYTDNTGSADTNLQLSRDRATNAMNEVAALGIDPSRLTAEGFGDQHPIADNSTPEGRQKNRRIDLNVTAK